MAQSQDLDRVVAQDTKSQVVRRRLDEDDVPRDGERGDRLLEGLRVAAGDDHLFGVDRDAFPRRDPLRQRGAQGERPFRFAVGDRTGSLALEGEGRGTPHGVQRQKPGVWLAEGELDDSRGAARSGSA